MEVRFARLARAHAKCAACSELAEAVVVQCSVAVAEEQSSEEALPVTPVHPKITKSTPIFYSDSLKSPWFLGMRIVTHLCAATPSERWRRGTVHLARAHRLKLRLLRSRFIHGRRSRWQRRLELRRRWWRWTIRSTIGGTKRTVSKKKTSYKTHTLASNRR